MTPAQQALKDKLARLKAAGGNSNGTPASSGTSGSTEIQQSIPEQKQEVPKNEGQPDSVQVPKGELAPGPVVLPEPKTEIVSKPNPVSEVDHPIKMQLAELEQALNDKLPGFKTILRDIHTKLRQDPAIVTLLSDEEIGGILAGLKHHAQVEIIAPKAAKAKKAAGKAMVANMSADDL